MKKSISKLSVLILVLTLLLSACGGNTSKDLIGTWIPESGSYAPDGFPDNMELFSDGTCEIEGYGGDYSVIDGRFKITANAGGGTHTFAFDFELTKETLTLTSDNESVSYIKAE